MQITFDIPDEKVAKIKAALGDNPKEIIRQMIIQMVTEHEREEDIAGVEERNLPDNNLLEITVSK